MTFEIKDTVKTKSGHLGEITSINSSTFPYYVKYSAGGGSGGEWCASNELNPGDKMGSQEAKFKIGDEVEALSPSSCNDVGDVGEIKGFGINTIHVKFKNDHVVGFPADELELIPTLKTLAKLWEEGGNNPVKAIDDNGIVIRVVGIDENRAIFGDGILGYVAYNSELPNWQLYQEPSRLEKLCEKSRNNSTEPEEKPTAAEMFMEGKNTHTIKEITIITPLSAEEVSRRYHNFIDSFPEVSMELESQPEEKKTETRCEHEERHIIELVNGNFECRKCQVELVEKWLWYIKMIIPSNSTILIYEPMTEKEAKGKFGDRLIKRATFSRELFEAGK